MPECAVVLLASVMLIYHGVLLALYPKRFRDNLIAYLDRHPVLRLIHRHTFLWQGWRDSPSYLVVLRITGVLLLAASILLVICLVQSIHEAR